MITDQIKNVYFKKQKQKRGEKKYKLKTKYFEDMAMHLFEFVTKYF